jgi:hypothetical protein
MVEAAVVSWFRAGSRLALLSAGLLGGASWSASAQASLEFPSAVSEALGMPCPPNCTTCHATPAGGLFTVVKPFGVALKGGAPASMLVISPKSVDSLRAALDKMRAANPPIDSDGDGTADLVELSAGNDPNNKGDARICGPEYGCGAHISRVPPARSGTALAVAGSVAALMALGFRRVSPLRR